MAAAWAVVLTALSFLLAAFGWLLLVLLVLVCILLFVPAFAKITYQEESFSVVAGILFVRVYLYPRFYIMWDFHAGETAEETAARLAKKEEKRLAKKAKKDAEQAAKKIDQKAAGKAAKITLDSIITLLRTAGMVMQLIFGELRIMDIRLRLPVQSSDPAQTAILYGKVNAWVYSTLAVLNNFLYLDFKELQIAPVFEENFAGSAYFSCKVSARLFIIVVVAYRLFETLRHEKELLALLLKGKARKGAQ